MCAILSLQTTTMIFVLSENGINVALRELELTRSRFQTPVHMYYHDWSSWCNLRVGVGELQSRESKVISPQFETIITCRANKILGDDILTSRFWPRTAGRRANLSPDRHRSRLGAERGVPGHLGFREVVVH